MSYSTSFGCALLVLVGAIFLANPAQSHEGDENSQGCHTDHRTGQYHCHTPKTAQPDPVTLTFCHVVRDASRCGHTRDACAQLVLQYGGTCEPQLSFNAR
jgi:hypothetical protein